MPDFKRLSELLANAYANYSATPKWQIKRRRLAKRYADGLPSLRVLQNQNSRDRARRIVDCSSAPYSKTRDQARLIADRSPTPEK